MRRHSRRTVSALLVLPLLLAGGLEVALAGSTQTATVRGHVADDKGEALVGVTLNLHADTLIRDRALITDASGNYFVGGLPPGKYSVTAQLGGYITTAFETLLVIDQTTVLNMVLKEGELTETVTVEGTKPVVDKGSTEGAVVVDKSFSESLPLGRAFQTLMGFAPGVANASSGNPNIAGGTASSNNYLFDGVSTRDPVTGTFGANIVFDSIEAVDTKLFGISAEYGQFQGGIANVITKTGGNTFTGSLRDRLTSPSWTLSHDLNAKEFGPAGVPTNPNTGLPANDDRGQADTSHELQTTLGGPIVRDHAWLFLTYQKIEQALSFQVGNPAGGPGADGIFPTVQQGDFSLIKGTYQATANQRFQYQWQEDPFSVPVCYDTTFFGGVCYEQYNVEKQQQGGYFWLANWDATWGAHVVTNVKVTRFRTGFPGNVPEAPVPDRPGLPHSRTSEMGLGIDLGSGDSFDNTVFSPVPNTRPREQYEASATMFFGSKNAGSHTVKVGLDYNKTQDLGSSTIAGNAIFYFTFLNPPPGVAGSNGTGDAYDVNNRQYLYWIDFAAPGQASSVNKFTNLYVQDDWQLNRHWSFNLGLRGEKSDNENDVGEKIISSTGIAPRLGAAFDVNGDGKHLLKATAARYLAGINLTTISPFIRVAGGQSEYNIFANITGPGTPTWVLVGQHSADPFTSQFASGIKPQRIDEYTLGYEFGVSPSLGFKANVIDRNWGDIITTQFSWDYSTGTPRKITRIDNSSEAKRKYQALFLQAEKRLSNGWQLLANYTYGKAQGNVTNEDGFDTFGSYPGVPQATNNRYGYEPWDVRHQLKGFAFYNLPLHSKRHALSIGGGLNYQTGLAYGKETPAPGPLVVVGPGPDGVQDVPLGSSSAGGSDDQFDNVVTFTEPRGARTAPSYWQLDGSINYHFTFAKKIIFESRFEVFNLTNNQKPTAIDSFINPDLTTGATFGYPTSYAQLQTPRFYDLIFAITW
jgi:hypothetical protein